MKQNITLKQLSELSDEGRQKLRDWLNIRLSNFNHEDSLADYRFHGEPFNYVFDWVKLMRSGKEAPLPLLSIGQMIEYLDEKQNNGWSYIDDSDYDHVITAQDEINVFDIGWKDELCDALWESVKYNLER